MSNALIFDDISRPEEPVQLGKNHYVLVGALHGEIVEHSKRQTESVKIVNGKIGGLTSPDVFDTELLSQCLYPTTADPSNPDGPRIREEKSVGLEFINSLPGEVADKLVKCLKDMSGITAREERLKAEADRLKKSSEKEN